MPVWVLGLTEGFAKHYGRHWRPSQRETARVLQVGKHVLANGLARIGGSLAKAKRAKILPARAGLKDTGADPGELAQLRWIDMSFESRKVNITPVKGHKPRYADVSSEFTRRVGATPRKSENAFNYETMKNTFQDARKRLARKLSNPRLLHISFTTYRHWKGTMEYHRTHDIMHVKDLPRHSRIENTVMYINLEKAIFNTKNDEFHCTVAKNVEGTCRLIESGFEYVTGEHCDGGKIFRKRK